MFAFTPGRWHDSGLRYEEFQGRTAYAGFVHMNEESGQPGSGDELTEDSVCNPATIVSGFCPVCTYDMRGLMETGDCPECGNKYHVRLLLPRPLPDTFSTCLRFLWPLAVFVVFSIIYFAAISNLNDIIVLVPIALIVLVIGIINSVVQSHILLRRHCALAHKGCSFTFRLGKVERYALELFILTVAWPLVVIGGLVVSMLLGVLLG